MQAATCREKLLSSGKTQVIVWNFLQNTSRRDLFLSSAEVRKNDITQDQSILEHLKEMKSIIQRPKQYCIEGSLDTPTLESRMHKYMSQLQVNAGIASLEHWLNSSMSQELFSVGISHGMPLHAGIKVQIEQCQEWIEGRSMLNADRELPQSRSLVQHWH